MLEDLGSNFCSDGCDSSKYFHLNEPSPSYLKTEGNGFD